MSDTLSPPSSSPVNAIRRTPAAAIIASVITVELASGITQGFLSPLLRGLTETLHVTAAQLNWLSIINLLASVAFTPVLSRMGDLYGHRKVLRVNLAIVLAGSILVGLASSFGMLMAGQALQGAFAGFFPLLVGILRNRTGAGESRRGIGLMVAALVGGLGFGMVASGLVAHFVATPTAALWVPAVAVSIALVVTWPLLPESSHRPGGRLDWSGGVLLTLGLIAIMLGLGMGGLPGWEWTSLRTSGLLVGAVALLAVWVWVELRSDAPMIDVRLFKRRNVTVVALVTTTFSFCLIGLQIATAIFLGASQSESGYGFGLDPLMIAIALLPGMLVLAASAIAAPRLAARIGDRTLLVLGSGLMALGYGGMIFGFRSLPFYLLTSAVAAVGGGIMQQGTRTLAVECVPAEQTAVGSGINELLINVGGSFGAAFVLSTFTIWTPVGATMPKLTAYLTVWGVCAAICAAGAVIALAFRAQSKAVAR